MKLLILLAVCVLSMTLVGAAGRPATPPPAAAPAPENAPQQPAPQEPQASGEWDPETQGIGDLTFARRPSPEEAGSLNKTTIPIVGERFSPEEFLQYVRKNVVPVLRGARSWKPSFIVLHNTAVPSIAQRKNGFTRANMDSLAHYYGKQGWKAGPHLFVDQNGIWVFSPLISRGTHSPCYNPTSWGIEQLGNFEQEQYDSGDGARIRDNAIAAMAILSLAGNITKGPQNNNNHIRFHKEDTCTDHACPGAHCKKNDVIAQVEAAKETWRKKWDGR